MTGEGGAVRDDSSIDIEGLDGCSENIDRFSGKAKFVNSKCLSLYHYIKRNTTGYLCTHFLHLYTSTISSATDSPPSLLDTTPKKLKKSDRAQLFPNTLVPNTLV